MDLEALITAIEQADGYAVDEIIDALQRRYHKLYPEEEIIFLALPRYDRAERKRIIEYLHRMET